MTTSTDNIPTGLERFNALLTWWGTPNGSNVEASTKSVEGLVNDLSQAFNDATSCQVRTMTETNEHLVRALQDLLQSRQPQGVMAAQSSIVAGLMESLAAQTKTWADLTQTVQGCCTKMIKEAADEAVRQAGITTSDVSVVQAESGRPAGKTNGKREAQS